MTQNYSCPDCSFELYYPVSQLEVSNWGIYDDARFKGRSIVSLQSHYTDLTQIPEEPFNMFMADIRKAMNILQLTTKCTRVNLAILGNTVNHVHAHLIPRYPNQEENPGKSPWNDPRPHQSWSKEIPAFIKKLKENA